MGDSKQDEAATKQDVGTQDMLLLFDRRRCLRHEDNNLVSVEQVANPSSSPSHLTPTPRGSFAGVGGGSGVIVMTARVARRSAGSAAAWRVLWLQTW